MDIGCAVGGASFELARAFPHVMGIDFSQHFVNAANVRARHRCCGPRLGSCCWPAAFHDVWAPVPRLPWRWLPHLQPCRTCK